MMHSDQPPQYNSLLAYAEAHAKNDPNRVALTLFRQDNTQQHWTNQAVLTAAQTYSDTLNTVLSQPGYRVLLTAENRPDWLFALLAIRKCGATAVILDPEMDETDLTALVKQCKIHVVITSDQYLQKFTKLTTPTQPIFCLAYETLTPCTPTRHIKTQPDEHSANMAVITFTSGSSGLPKGVMLDEKRLLACGRTIIRICKGRPHHNLLAVLPQFHILAFNGNIVMPTLLNSQVAFVEALDAPRLMSVLRQFNPTHLILVPRILDVIRQEVTSRLARLPKPLAWLAQRTGLVGKQVRKIFGNRLVGLYCGGSFLNPETQQFFLAHNVPVFVGYGLAESSGFLSVEMPGQQQVGSLGIAPEEVEIRIDNPNKHGEGEIVARSPYLMHSYFRNANETNKKLKQGWLHTGDIGRIDKQGFLILTDRSNNIIVTASGKKAYPAQIEAHYPSLPGVTEFAVTGVQNPKTQSDIIHAAVVLTTAENLDSEAARAQQQEVLEAFMHCAANLPSHLQISRVHFVRELPKTRTMKIKYPQLKKMITALSEHAAESHPKTLAEQPPFNYPNERSKAIAKAIREYLDSRLELTLTPNHDQLALHSMGVDSLQQMALAGFLTKTYGEEAWLTHFRTTNNIAKLAVYIDEHWQAIHSNTPAQKATQRVVNTDYLTQPKPKWLLNIFNAWSRIVWKLTITGTEHLDPDRAYIFVANHGSHLDPIWMLCGLPDAQQDRITLLGKQEHWDHWLSRTLAEKFHAIPIDREGDFTASLALSKQHLQAGRSFIIFPEGTRKLGKKINAFKPGAVLLAQETGVPIVPVAIRGAHDIYPPQRWLPRLFNWRAWQRYTLRVHFGKPIDVAEHSDMALNALSDHVRDKVCSLRNQLDAANTSRH